MALAVGVSWAGLWRLFAPWDVIALVATLAGGYPIFREAFEAVRERRMTMELSMTIALGAALAVGEFFTALVIVLFVLVAEVLEGLTVSRGRHAIQHLLDLLPHTATVRRDGGTEEVEAELLRVGDVVVVRPGSRLPVDGVVVAGHSFVDQAPITGESMPVEKGVGATVYAGTINQSGAMEVRTSGIGRDTAFGRIIQAVEQARHARAPIQKTADRLAGYLVYFALGCAALTFAITRDARATISVIIVAGACGIAAGTPLAILGAIGRSARAGAIVKGGIHLEMLGNVDTVVLDKTGTLTLGQPQVVELQPCSGISAGTLLAVAAGAERSSEHPLGAAIVQRAAAEGIHLEEAQGFHYTPGRGIACVLAGAPVLVGNRALLAEQGLDLFAVAAPQAGLTEVLVARGGAVLGSIQIADVVREGSAAAIQALHRLGIRTVLLTGDAEVVAQTVGRELGVDEIAADLLPHEKQERVRSLVAAGKKVAMVGDGINDAPALTAANVGVAMGSGTDVAQESADVVLLGNDLLKFVETIEIARRCRRIIMQNFAGTLVVDGLGVALAAFGLLNPLFAAFIHVTSELVFILNSTRLLPRGSSPGRP